MNKSGSGLEVLKKSSTDLANRLGELERKVADGGKVKPLRSNDAAPAVDRLARDIHRISVEVDILEGQILGGHQNAGGVA